MAGFAKMNFMEPLKIAIRVVAFELKRCMKFAYLMKNLLN